MMNLIKRITDKLRRKPLLVKPVVSGHVKNAHLHKWELQYRTGNATGGKSEVCKCQCGQWAVRHYGQAEYNLING
jgi:hypothetical protein